MKRGKICLILPVLTFGLWAGLPAQEACVHTFTGTVHDQAGEPLTGATVLFPDSLHGTATDAGGAFRFEHVCGGTYMVVVQFVGYATSRFRVSVAGDIHRTVILSQQSSELAEVVVEDKTAGTETVQNFMTLSGKLLDAVAGKSIGETLKEVPGVNTIQTGPGIFKPVIHGVHSQRILILNHGIPQEGQQWGAEHAPEIDPFIASNIVVIKDASAIKYGTDALGGVIVVNPPPLPEHAALGGSLSLIGQSNGRMGTASGTLEGGVPRHDGWGWRIQATRKRGGDFQAPDYMLTNTGVKELDFSGAAGYHEENFGAEVFFSHFETSLGILRGSNVHSLNDLVTAMEREPPQYTSAFSYHFTEPYQHVRHHLLKINAHGLTAKSEWRIQYGYQDDARQEYEDRAGVPDYIPTLDLRLDTHTIEMERESLPSKGLSTCFGFSTMYQVNNNVPGTRRLPFIPNFNSTSTGAFAIASLSLTRWTADLGLRYDYRNYRVAGYDFKNTLYKTNLNFHNASVTTGITHTLDDRQAVKLNVSSAWRPPHVSELYSIGKHQSAAAIEYGLLLNDSTNEIEDIDQAQFKIEQAVKSVATYSYETTRVRVEGTAYANYIANYIYLRPAGVTASISGVFPYFRYTQTDALFLGADLSGSWRFAGHFELLPRVSLLRASDYRHSDYLVYTPPNRYEATLRYERPAQGRIKDLFVESRIRYTDRQNRAPRVITPRDFQDAEAQGADPFGGTDSNFDFMTAPDGYLLLDVSLGFSLKGNHMKYDFRAGLDNFTNVSYREYTNRFRYFADDIGRNFKLSFKCAF